MKSASELAEIAIRRDSWKYLKLWVWAHDYGYKADEWNNIMPPVTGDRRVFINIYRQIYEAIESLPENPNSIVVVAMNRYINSERFQMDEIKRRFENDVF